MGVVFGLQLEKRAFMCCFQETGLYEYKVFGVLTTCTPELCADVYMDLAYRKNWDGYVKGKIINTDLSHPSFHFLPRNHSPC